MTARKAYSRMGFLYLIFSLVVLVAQLCLSFILYRYFPAVYENYTALTVLSSVSLYVVGLMILLPGARLIFHKEKTVPEKHAMKVSQLLQAFCVTYLLVVVSNWVGQIVIGFLESFSETVIENPVDDLVEYVSPLVLLVLTGLIAPVFEEWFFRKILVDRLLKYGEGKAILVSGLMFGLFHGNLDQFFYAFAIGSFFAYLYIRTGKVHYVMILHGMLNILSSVVLNGLLSLVDLEAFYAAATDSMALLRHCLEDPVGISALLIAEGLVYCVLIAGMIFLIRGKKYFFLRQRDDELPGEGRFKPALVNAGMLCFIIYSAVYILMETFWL